MKMYSYKNQRGQTYYLHQRGKLFFFSKDPQGAIEMPPGRIVKENPRTGLPLLAKSV